MSPSVRKRLLILAIAAVGAVLALSVLDVSQPWRDNAVRSGVLAAVLIAGFWMRHRRRR